MAGAHDRSVRGTGRMAGFVLPGWLPGASIPARPICLVGSRGSPQSVPDPRNEVLSLGSHFAWHWRRRGASLAEPCPHGTAVTAGWWAARIASQRECGEGRPVRGPLPMRIRLALSGRVRIP